MKTRNRIEFPTLPKEKGNECYGVCRMYGSLWAFSTNGFAVVANPVTVVEPYQGEPFLKEGDGILFGSATARRMNGPFHSLEKGYGNAILLNNSGIPFYPAYLYHMEIGWERLKDLVFSNIKEELEEYKLASPQAMLAFAEAMLAHAKSQEKVEYDRGDHISPWVRPANDKDGIEAGGCYFSHGDDECMSAAEFVGKGLSLNNLRVLLNKAGKDPIRVYSSGDAVIVEVNGSYRLAIRSL